VSARDRILTAMGRFALRGLEVKDDATRRASASKEYVYGGNSYTSDWDFERAVRDGFERVIWVAKGLDANATKVAEWPVKVMEGSAPEWREVQDAFAPLMRKSKLNEIDGPAYAFLYKLALQFQISKAGVFVEVIPSKGGGIAALNLLPPGITRPIPDPSTFTAGYEITLPGGDVMTLPKYDPRKRAGVLWIKRQHPSNPYSSWTPLEAAGISIDLDFYARVYNRNFLLNDGRSAQELKARFSPGMGGVGRTTVIEADSISVQDTAMSPRDAQYAELRGITKEDIMLAVGVPETVLGNASGRTFDNADAEIEVWLNTTVKGLARWIGEGLSPLTEGGFDDDRTVWFDWSNEEVLKRAQRKADDVAAARQAAGLITVDEYRQLAKLDPIGRPGSQVLWIPGGKAAVGQEADETAAGELKPIGGGAPAAPGGALGMAPEELAATARGGAIAGATAAREAADSDSLTDPAGVPRALAAKALPKQQQCKFCDEQAVARVIHSEGMAYVPACAEHLAKAKDAAARSTPDGSVYPGNIDAVRGMDGRPYEAKALDRVPAGDRCVCCSGVGEHSTGRECYRCDASGREIDNDGGPVPCDGAFPSDHPSRGQKAFELDQFLNVLDGLTVELKRYNPKQPRYPKGHPLGGRWMSMADIALWKQGKPLTGGYDSSKVKDPETGKLGKPTEGPNALGADNSKGPAPKNAKPTPKAAASAGAPKANAPAGHWSNVLNYPDDYPYAKLPGGVPANTLKAPKNFKAVSVKKGDVVHISGQDWTVSGNSKVGGKQQLSLVSKDGTTRKLSVTDPDTPVPVVARTPQNVLVTKAKKEKAAEEAAGGPQTGGDAPEAPTVKKPRVSAPVDQDMAAALDAHEAAAPAPIQHLQEAPAEKPEPGVYKAPYATMTVHPDGHATVKDEESGEFTATPEQAAAWIGNGEFTKTSTAGAPPAGVTAGVTYTNPDMGSTMVFNEDGSATLSVPFDGDYVLDAQAALDNWVGDDPDEPFKWDSPVAAAPSLDLTPGKVYAQTDDATTVATILPNGDVSIDYNDGTSPSVFDNASAAQILMSDEWIEAETSGKPESAGELPTYDIGDGDTLTVNPDGTGAMHWADGTGASPVDANGVDYWLNDKNAPLISGPGAEPAAKPHSLPAGKYSTTGDGVMTIHEDGTGTLDFGGATSSEFTAQEIADNQDVFKLIPSDTSASDPTTAPPFTESPNPPAKPEGGKQYKNEAGTLTLTVYPDGTGSLHDTTVGTNGDPIDPDDVESFISHTQSPGQFFKLNNVDPVPTTPVTPGKYVTAHGSTVTVNADGTGHMLTTSGKEVPLDADDVADFYDEWTPAPAPEPTPATPDFSNLFTQLTTPTSSATPVPTYDPDAPGALIDYPADYPYPVVDGAPPAKTLGTPKFQKGTSMKKGDVVSVIMGNAGSQEFSVVKTKKVGNGVSVYGLNANGDTIPLGIYGDGETIKVVAKTPQNMLVAQAKKDKIAAGLSPDPILPHTYGTTPPAAPSVKAPDEGPVSSLPDPEPPAVPQTGGVAFSATLPAEKTSLASQKMVNSKLIKEGSTIVLPGGYTAQVSKPYAWDTEQKTGVMWGFPSADAPDAIKNQIPNADGAVPVWAQNFSHPAHPGFGGNKVGLISKANMKGAGKPVAPSTTQQAPIVPDPTSTAPYVPSGNVKIVDVAGGVPRPYDPAQKATQKVDEVTIDGKDQWFHTTSVGAKSVKQGDVIYFQGDPAAPYLVTKQDNKPGSKEIGIWGKQNGTGPEKFLFLSAPSSGERQVQVQTTPPPGWVPPPPPPPPTPGVKLVIDPSSVKSIKDDEGSAGARQKFSQMYDTLQRQQQLAQAFKLATPEQKIALESAGLGTQQAFVQHMEGVSGDWDGSSNDHNPKMLAFHHATATEFGLEDVAPWGAEQSDMSLKSNTKKHLEKFGPAYQAAARLIYQNTQNEFKKRGITRVQLYRRNSFSPPDNTGSYSTPAPPWAWQEGTTTDVSLRPLSSFAWNPKSNFGPLQLAATVPIEMVFSMGKTGPGGLSKSENELVTLGVKNVAWEVSWEGGGDPAKHMPKPTKAGYTVEDYQKQYPQWHPGTTNSTKGLQVKADGVPAPWLRTFPNDQTEDWAKTTWPYVDADGDDVDNLADLYDLYPDVVPERLLNLPIGRVMPALMRQQLLAAIADPEDDAFEDTPAIRPETKTLQAVVLDDDSDWIGL